MKYLKIEDNKGYYIKDATAPTNWVEIDQIEKDDLLNLLDHATSNDFELDAYEENLLGNKAHQIIYKHIAEKFTTFLTNKDRFKDEAENLFKTALEKYQ
ncbi:hypothetical protein NU08_1317 [Flavobacterium anhuiense]|uniref:Uncharacterized protein n=1 Tax=Flavobacterium anhuiense TaxID=459526 RepID=A0A444W1X0_9FLAO|nr:hypothetical protein [Flavobacterium anhuiense]RYJ39648.1 hypothetical protein NU08_1317 [Flavobacterium anhuiense]